MKKTLAAAIMAACLPAGAASAQEYPEMTLKLAHFAPAAWGSSQVDQFFADEVSRRSGGKIKVEIYWAGALGAAMEIVDLVKDEAVDLGATALVYFPAQLPLAGMTTGIPGVFQNIDEALAVHVRLINENAPLRDEYKRNNMYPIVKHALATYRLQCTKPVKTLADLKGLRVRSFGAVVPAVFEKFGIQPVSLLLPEIYEGLQRGSIDCAFLSDEVANVLKLQEVAKHWSTINLGASAAYSTFTTWENWHEKWPREVTELMEGVAEEALEMERKMVVENEKLALEALRAAGGEVVEFADNEQLWTSVPDVVGLWESAVSTDANAADVKAFAADLRTWLKEVRDAE